MRRDLRLADNPALAAAAERGPVVPLFVRDPAFSRAGQARRSRLEASLEALGEQLGGALVVRSGEPAEVVAQVAAEVGAGSVHMAGEFTPYAVRRDRAVATRLERDGVTMRSSGTPYAVRPGTVVSGQGTPYKVFTPFGKAWREQAVELPTMGPDDVRWHGLGSEPLDADLLATARRFAPAGELATLERWQEFVADGVADYAEQRDRPDVDGTTRMSVALRLGEIHPRTMLRDLAALGDHDADGVRALVNELAWREFYADVLWQRPDSAWRDLREQPGMVFDDGPEVDALVEAWRNGRTGFPFVDAGMRQLLETGWMHNRVRMVVASFLVKDLHVRWQVGARHFLDQLIDGDLASNSHGWQWAAGTGTDAAPYFRVFNPVSQGKRFDPQGDYVRRWIPELRHLTGAHAHEPWRRADGYRDGYPERIVDHAAERREALDRYHHARQS